MRVLGDRVPFRNRAMLAIQQNSCTNGRDDGMRSRMEAAGRLVMAQIEGTFPSNA